MAEPWSPTTTATSVAADTAFLAVAVTVTVVAEALSATLVSLADRVNEVPSSSSRRMYWVWTDWLPNVPPIVIRS